VNVEERHHMTVHRHFRAILPPVSARAGGRAPLAALLLGLLLACGGDGGRATPEAAAGDREPRADAFTVALLTPGPISDKSWNGGAYAGLLQIRDSLGASISHIQTRTPAEFAENFRHYGAQGYDLVFGHGFEFQDAAERVAPDFPHTIYVTTSGNRTSANVAGMTFTFEEPSYLAGIAAGALSRSHVIGVIGGTEIPPVKSSFDAFAAGARSIDPRVTVLTAYLGNWDDVSAGKEAALAQLARGADVIFQNADAAGLGIFQAVREHGAAYVVGANVDQNDVAPTVTLGSVVIDLPHAFLLVAREVKEGRFRPRVITLDTRDDVVRFVINPRLADRIPAPARAAIDSVNQRMHEAAFSAPGLRSAFDGQP
jgi:basic membrane lipoprotein Med (substrate-binding protein (PBP1-ABC) superfamily)